MAISKVKVINEVSCSYWSVIMIMPNKSRNKTNVELRLYKDEATSKAEDDKKVRTGIENFSARCPMMFDGFGLSLAEIYTKVKANKRANLIIGQWNPETSSGVTSERLVDNFFADAVDC